MDWKRVGKYTFIVSVICLILGALWKNLVLGGLGIAYIVWWNEIFYSLAIIGAVMWFLAKKPED